MRALPVLLSLVVLSCGASIAPCRAADADSGNVVVRGAQHAGHAVAEGARKGGRAVARGARKGGHAVARGARKGGHAVAEGARKGGHAVAQGARSAGRWVSGPFRGDQTPSRAHGTGSGGSRSGAPSGGARRNPTHADSTSGAHHR